MQKSFKGLQLEKSWNGWQNGKKLLVGHLDGNFTRETVLRELGKLAKSLRKEGRNVHLGVSAHYADPDTWCPALMFDVKGAIKFYNPSDSPTTEEYKDIDALYFYVVETEETVLKNKVYTRKKEQNMIYEQNNKKKKQ